MGWRNEEGGWTHLLGGVVDDTIDFALETVDLQSDVSGDMYFTYSIITTMYAYINPLNNFIYLFIVK